MDTLKVIITKPKQISKRYSLENEIGLSTYDIALLSFRKKIMKNKSLLKETTKNTYLI